VRSERISICVIHILSQQVYDVISQVGNCIPRPTLSCTPSHPSNHKPTSKLRSARRQPLSSSVSVIMKSWPGTSMSFILLHSMPLVAVISSTLLFATRWVARSGALGLAARYERTLYLVVAFPMGGKTLARDVMCRTKLSAIPIWLSDETDCHTRLAHTVSPTSRTLHQPARCHSPSISLP
jgi:hypothetical protein